MLKVLSCLATEHDLRFVLVAAIVCVLGSVTAVRLFCNTYNVQTGTRALWAFLAAFAFGSAVWATHFLAMLAFEPGLPTGYEPKLTILSLFVAIVAMTIGFSVASHKTPRAVPVLGGFLSGLGIGAMHYTGMAALRTAGHVQWDFSLVVASVVIGAATASFALYRLSGSQAAARQYEVAGLLVLAVIGHHFTAMGSVTILPDPTVIVPEQVMPNYLLAASVAAVSLLVIGTGFATYFIEHRARRVADSRIHHLAYFDTLTNLPNRAAFLDRLDSDFREAEAQDHRLALLSIDLDRFKEVNDVFGHGFGDRVLAEIGQRVHQHFAARHFVARLGGDELIAIHASQGSPKDSLDFAERLIAEISREMDLDGNSVKIGASIGIAVYPDDGKTAQELMANADLAMYRAKKEIGNKICFFERAMDDQVRQRRALGLALREALPRNELELHYQVQKRISTDEVIGYEALLRWNHPARGTVPPGEFIPIAEETGAIIPIGTWVIETACAVASAWPKGYRVAVNLSPVQFTQPDLPNVVHQILLKTGLAPSRLELEITESTLIKDMSRTLHILRRLKALGVTIAMDDFGTGYSSLSTLQAFPFDKIKIDRSFVEKVANNAHAASIVRAVLALGKSLSIPVLAEGIETEAHLAFMRAEGCDEAQGFLLGRPGRVDWLAQPPATQAQLQAQSQAQPQCYVTA